MKTISEYTGNWKTRPHSGREAVVRRCGFQSRVEERVWVDLSIYVNPRRLPETLGLQIYMYICMYVCMSVCVCVYIYIYMREREKEILVRRRVLED